MEINALKILSYFAIVLIILGIYDFMKTLLFKNKYKELEIRFVASHFRCIGVIVGVLLAVVGIIAGFMTSKYELVVLGATCFSCAAGEFNHCIIGIAEKQIVINGREIDLNVIAQNGNTRKVFYLSLFEIETNMFREYVFVKRNFNIDNLIGIADEA